MRAQLSNAGYGLLLCAAITLATIVLGAVRTTPGEFALGLLLGGIAGQVLALRGAGRPAWAGARFAKIPRKLSLQEQRLHEHVMSISSTRWMVLGNMPYFAAIIGYMVLARPRIDLGASSDHWPGAFFGFFYVFGVAVSIRYIRALRRLPPDRTD